LSKMAAAHGGCGFRANKIRKRLKKNDLQSTI
jgi:hypothetical protein